MKYSKRNSSNDHSIPASRSMRGLFFTTLCAFFVFTGCITDDVGRMRYELNMLKKEVSSIKKTSKSMESELPGQTKQIDAKMKKVENKQKATAASVSDLLFRMQNLTTDFQSLTGQIEEARFESEQKADELAKSNESIVARLAELEAAVNELKTKLPAADSAAKKADIPGTSDSSAAPKAGQSATAANTAKDVYMKGYQDMKAGKTEKARETFSSVLSDFPENDYSDNARFWIGESYYDEERYEDAILAYEELFKHNPKSDKIPGAMLKQGLAFYALKDKNTGKIILEKLIEKYPGTEQAKAAARKIKKAGTPKKK